MSAASRCARASSSRSALCATMPSSVRLVRTTSGMSAAEAASSAWVSNRRAGPRSCSCSWAWPRPRSSQIHQRSSTHPGSHTRRRRLTSCCGPARATGSTWTATLRHMPDGARRTPQVQQPAHDLGIQHITTALRLFHHKRAGYPQADRPSATTAPILSVFLTPHGRHGHAVWSCWRVRDQGDDQDCIFH